MPAFLNPLPVGRIADAADVRQMAGRAAIRRPRPDRIVNRVWQSLFRDRASSRPARTWACSASRRRIPELLDWLAVEFMESGWSLKHLHRLIATSADLSPVVAGDRPICWLAIPTIGCWHAGRGSGWTPRSCAISPYRPADCSTPRSAARAFARPRPAFLFQPPASYGPKVWNEATGIERYRRAFYTFRYRSVPYPMLQAFDAPNGDFACVRRTRSNTPLQALTTLNEPIYLECARALAPAHAAKRGGSSEADRLDYAFRRCLARAPSDAEKSTLLELLSKQTRRFESPGPTPWALAAGDPEQAARSFPAGATPPRLAAWTAVARVLAQPR